MLASLRGRPPAASRGAGLAGRSLAAADSRRWTRSRGSRIRRFLTGRPALAGLLARGSRGGRARLRQRLFLGPATIADNGQEVASNLVRGTGTRRVMLAQKIHQRAGAHAIGEALGVAVTPRAIRRENRWAGFAALQILGSRGGGQKDEKPKSNQKRAADCGQGIPPEGSLCGSATRRLPELTTFSP